MKKRLTSIVTYSSPLGVGFNKESFTAAGKSLLIGLPLFFFGVIFFDVTPGIFLGVLGFMTSFVIRVGVIDGKPAPEYIRQSIDLLWHPGKQSLSYAHAPDEERLIIEKEVGKHEEGEEALKEGGEEA